MRSYFSELYLYTTLIIITITNITKNKIKFIHFNFSHARKTPSNWETPGKRRQEIAVLRLPFIHFVKQVNDFSDKMEKMDIKLRSPTSENTTKFTFLQFFVFLYHNEIQKNVEEGHRKDEEKF